MEFTTLGQTAKLLRSSFLMTNFSGTIELLITGMTAAKAYIQGDIGPELRNQELESLNAVADAIEKNFEGLEEQINQNREFNIASQINVAKTIRAQRDAIYPEFALSDEAFEAILEKDVADGRKWSIEGEKEFLKVVFDLREEWLHLYRRFLELVDENSKFQNHYDLASAETQGNA